MNDVLFALGLAVVILSGLSVLFTMVLPRRPAGLQRVGTVIYGAVRLIFVGLARLVPSFEAKDAVLAPMGPVALVAQLASWAAGFVLGFGLMLVPTTDNLADGMLQALGSVFTVGAIHPGGPENVPVDVAAGATWVVVVALQIAYLPALYAAFSQREGLVAMLESRAGVPAWGPELLVRHQLVGIVDTLPELYSAWEEWSAEVAESHTTYPVLLLFRSPEPWYSWLLSLLAVLDAAAMHLALSPSTASSNARLCLRMGFTCLDRIGTSLGWDIDADPSPEGPIDLSVAEFEHAVRMLEEAEFPTERSAADAWPDFRGWRVNYEAVAYRLADHLVVPPAPWSGPRRHIQRDIVEPRRPPHRRPASSAAAFDPRPAPRRRARASRPPGSRSSGPATGAPPDGDPDHD